MLQTYSDTTKRELDLIDALVASCYSALPSFRAWTASTMLYFAAVTTYERRRTSTSSDAKAFAHDFLCADEDALQRIAQEAYRRVASWPADQPRSPAQIEAYEQFIEEAVQPYNRVGLFDPPVANMYPHTAAPV